MQDDDTGRHYTSHDGLQLFYRDFGADKPGTPIVCLPGLTRNSRDFEDLAHRLSDRRRVLAPDLRGRGFSAYDTNWRNYHPSTYLRDVLTLLDTLGIEKVIVVGTSLGGLIVMAIAEHDSNRLAGVVINDIGPEIAPEGLARIQAYTGRLPAVGNWPEAIAQTKDIYGQWLPGLSDEDWEKMARRAYREGDDGTPRLDMDPNIGNAVRAVGPQLGDPWQRFDALRDVPAVLLHGELSDILSVDIVARMKERKPDLVTVNVPNRGHVPLLDEPECITAIEQLIEGL